MSRPTTTGRWRAVLTLAAATALVTALGAGGVETPVAQAAPQPSPSSAAPPAADDVSASPTSTAAASPSPSPAPTATPKTLTPSPRPSTIASSSATPTPDPTGLAPGDTPAAAADQPLVVGAAATPTAATTVGQAVAYTFTVRNTGSGAVTAVVVQAPGAGLSPLVCAPVREGGTLAAGAVTTCRTSRTPTLDDLRQPSLTDTVSASAQTADHQPVTATASVRVAVTIAPPRATDQHKWVIAHGKTVVFPAARAATPATLGGPPIDVARTFFPDAEFYDGKIQYGAGVWTVLPDGSVRFDPSQDGPGEETLRYRVFDVLGHSTTATLTVTVRPSATTKLLTVSTLQGQPLTFDPLRSDTPSQDLDGSRASFVRSSVRLAPDPLSTGGAVLSPDQKSYLVPSVGTYTVGSDGDVTFAPDPHFTSTTGIIAYYTVQDTVGSQATGAVQVRVVPLRPKTHDESLATTYGRPVTFRAASDDTPGNPVAPLDRSATALTAPPSPGGYAPAWSTNESTTIVDRAGTWQVRGDGSVQFSPASGYSGTDTVGYVAVDRNGTRSRAVLTVTVRPGPVARGDRWATGQGDPVTLDVLADDTPGQRVDGSAGSFVGSSLRFAVAGQPSGSTLSASRTTLTVPGQGTWSATDGRLVYDPAPGFAGGTALVTYQVTDSAGSIATATADVTVTSDAPAANDDRVATPFRTPVVVDGSRDDSAGGGSAKALDYASTVFPVDGQPAGSSRTADGKTLAVPGQGSWVLSPDDGTATFTPDAAFVGTTSPVTYAVADLDGLTARATMQVQVRPGPQPRPDLAVLAPAQHQEVGFGVLLNDVPSRNADGTLGHTDRTTLRLAATGQPAGWTVSPDRRQASSTTGQRVFIEPVLGVFEVYAVAGATGSTGHLVYTVDDLATTASGRTVRHPMSSYVQVDFRAAAPPTATPDSAETRSPDSVSLPATRNDVPGDPAVPVVLGSVTFPSAQLSRLPAGSRIEPYGINWTLTVPGVGRWTTNNTPHGSRVGMVDFVPEAGFVGVARADYRMGDVVQHQAVSTLSVTVRPGYTARPDVARTSQGVPVSLDVVANDDPGQNPDGSAASFAGAIRILDDDGGTYGWPATTAGITRPVAGQGTWHVDYVGSVATFTPLPAFTGVTTPVRIGVGQDVDATVQVTVDPVVPVARPDTASTAGGAPVVVRVLANDAAGVAQVPLDERSVRLLAAAGSTLSSEGKALTVPGRGVFLVSGDGQITFVPTGPAAASTLAVGYSVADANGTTTRSTLTVKVDA